MRRRILTAILAVVMVLTVMPVVSVYATTTAHTPGNDRAIRLNDVVDIFNNFPENPQSANAQNIYFDNLDVPFLVSSHIQGYARYEDFHIFSYSNLAGQQGHIYFLRDGDRPQSYQLRVPLTATRENELFPGGSNDWINHPGGIQVIGDYLLIAMQSASSAPRYGKKTFVYIVYLGPLRNPDGITLKQNGEINLNAKMLLLSDQPGGSAGVGIIDVCSSFGGNPYVPGTVRYMIAIRGAASDNRASIYFFLSNPTNSLWNATFPEVTGATDADKIHAFAFQFLSSSNYQTLALLGCESGEIFMLGFNNRGQESARLYPVTQNSGTDFNWQIPTYTAERRMNGAGCCSFRNAGGLQIINRDTMVITMTERDPWIALGPAQRNHFRISTFQAETIPYFAEGIYLIQSAETSRYVSIKNNSTGNRANLVMSEQSGSIETQFHISSVPGGLRIGGGNNINAQGVPQRFIEVRGSSRSHNAEIQMYNWTSPYECKLWRFEANSDGTYRIVNVNSGLYLGYDGDTVKQRNIATNFHLIPHVSFGMAMAQVEEFNGEPEVEPDPIPLTRGDMLLIMYYLFSTGSANELSGFYDIDESEYGAYYQAAVAWAFENGITSGVGNNLFGKHNLITKEQFVTFLFRVFEYMGMDTTANLSQQASERIAQSGIARWAQEAMEWAVYRGFFTEDEIHNFLYPVTNQDTTIIVEALIVEMNADVEPVQIEPELIEPEEGIQEDEFVQNANEMPEEQQNNEEAE